MPCHLIQTLGVEKIYVLSAMMHVVMNEFSN